MTSIESKIVKEEKPKSVKQLQLEVAKANKALQKRNQIQRSMIGEDFKHNICVATYSRIEAKHLNEQQELFKKHINANNYVLINAYVDDVNDHERPAFLKLQEDIKKQKVKKILVSHVSVLTRDVIHLETLNDELFKPNGVRVIGIEDSYDNFNVTSKGKKEAKKD